MFPSLYLSIPQYVIGDGGGRKRKKEKKKKRRKRLFDEDEDPLSLSLSLSVYLLLLARSRPARRSPRPAVTCQSAQTPTEIPHGFSFNSPESMCVHGISSDDTPAGRLAGPSPSSSPSSSTGCDAPAREIHLCHYHVEPFR
jgi:hypothetical protein